MGAFKLLACALAALGLTSAAPLTLNHFKRSITNDTAGIADQHFDFIIAGGGLTGLTVASKLTEDANVTVLVIEIGYDQQHDPRVYDVRTYGEAFGTELDHAFKSTPISWRDDEQLSLVAGRMLGGSGSLNGASWTKGPRTQYDLLPLLTGDESWNFENFNQYMLRSEHFNAPEPNSPTIAKGAQYLPQYHGISGPVEVSFANGMFATVQLDAINASQKIWPGLKVNPDAASGVVNGVTTIPDQVQSDVEQNRCSAYTAYIQKKEADKRPNLTILTGHRVTKIHWKKDNSGLTASSVSFQHDEDSPPITAHVEREVLLACGALQSPQLLELSGVGDPSVLEPLGIGVNHPLAQVGRNFEEQTKNALTFKPKSTDFRGTGPSSAIAFPNVYQVLGEDLARSVYSDTKAGLPAFATSLEKGGFILNGTTYLPVLQAQLDNLFLAREAAVEVFFTVSTKTGLVGTDLWNLIVLSRGSIHINSTNSFAHPLIEPSYFRHPLDLLLQTHATKQARQVYNTPPLNSLVESEVSPGLSVLSPDASFDQWEDYVLQSFTSVWHPIASLAMMKEEFGGVVDSRFKVYGLENVRVVDASVLPVQLSAHLSSSLYGMAEKVSENIKEDWDHKKERGPREGRPRVASRGAGC